MYDDLQPYLQKIREQKPYLFPTTPSRFCEYSYVPTQWQDIFTQLIEDIDALGAPYPTIAQLKEKFGTARYYFDYPDQCTPERIKLLNQLISTAESKSIPLE